MKKNYPITSKRFLLLLLACLSVFGSIWPANNLLAQTLVWEENFNSTLLAPNAWTYDFGNGSGRDAGYGWGNSELEYYTSRQDNVRIENGNLIIEARRENFDGSVFTSGRIKTEGRVHFKYGTVEARIKLPNMANGLWPALWTLGTVGPSWPSIGEIDILEAGAAAAIAANKVNNQISSANHWSNSTGGRELQTGSTVSAADLSADFHLYKMVWTSQYIKMYLDNVEFYSFDIISDPNKTEFHNPHFLLLNLAVGGAYTNIFNPNGITASLPAKMYVDYIKLYQNPGDELILGENVTVSGNFGVLTETTPFSAKLNFGSDATLYYWNNLTPITNPAPVAFEGSLLWAVRANSGDWFGMGISNNYVNLKDFGAGSLKFRFKTTYGGQFKFGVKTGHGEAWVNVPAGGQQFGVKRDGTWQQVTIPMADFNNSSVGNNIDVQSLKGAFMFAGDPTNTAADFYFDDIYFSRTAIPGSTGGTNGITAAPEPPARNAGDVISLFSGAYANRPNTDFFPNWGQSTVVTDTTIQGNVTKKYENLNYQGVQFTPNINAGTMEKLHMDIWTANSIALKFFIINEGPVEKSVTLQPTLSGWNSFDIELNQANFPGIDFTKVFQFKFDIAPTEGARVYLDNIYFYKTPSTVVGIAPTVSITAPANNTNFTAPANIAITANAADADGTITKVEFFKGSDLLGTDITAPYSFDWNNVPAGNYSLTAKATDNDNNVVTSLLVAVSVKPQACTGTAVSGDYSYEVYTQNGTVYFTFIPLAPIAGSNLSIINIKEGSGGFGGYGMTASGANFTLSRPIADGVLLTFYFTYNTPPAGERNSSANPHTYVVGTVCVPGAPLVSITSPLDGASFVAPANILINATASDPGGSINKVEFYNGATLLGMDETSPYSFQWDNVAAGPYVLTAKAIDNTALSTISAAVNITVNAPNLNGFCGTAASGDYEYSASTANGIVTFRFHPLMPIIGSNNAIINISAPSNINVAMTRSGTDFVYSLPFENGTNVTFYFTYNTPAAGERNSSASRHTYTVGTNCLGVTTSVPSATIVSPVNDASYTEPATITINANAADVDGTVTSVRFYNCATLLGTDETSPYSVTWTGATAGSYTISSWATNNRGYTTISNLVKVLVNINNTGGFCGTAPNGDYSYRVESAGDQVTFTFHPLTPIAGSNNALIYIRETPGGGYPGYGMTPVGSDFRFTKTIAPGTNLSIYFTYAVPSGGERNSSATPHSYTTGTNCTGSLPVTLSGFTAFVQPTGEVAIQWSTTREENNDYFEVEKSTNGTRFTRLTRVKAAGGSLLTNQYATADQSPQKGMNYYRLTQVDRDGKKTVYGVKTVRIGGRSSSVAMYPNPLTGNIIYITNGEAGQFTIPFVPNDMAGRVVFRGLATGQSDGYKLKFNNKPAAGIYMVALPGSAPIKLVVQ